MGAKGQPWAGRRFCAGWRRTTQPGPAQRPGDSCESSPGLAVWPDPCPLGPQPPLPTPLPGALSDLGIASCSRSRRLGKEVVRHMVKQEGSVTCWEQERGPGQRGLGASAGAL